MINLHLYKLFNKDLQNMNNNQLLQHWKGYGNSEKRICSIETFFAKYPDFDYITYKISNNLIFNNKIDLMIHKHYNSIIINIGNNLIENLLKIFSGLLYSDNLYINSTKNYSLFEKLKKLQNNKISYKPFNNIDKLLIIQNIDKCKSYLNFNKTIQLCNLFNNTKLFLGIYISENNIDELYYQKCLSLLNYNEMNIILFIKDSKKVININIDYHLNTLTEEEDILLLLAKCNYIITDNSEFCFWGCVLGNATKIYIPYNYINTNIIINNNEMFKNFIFIDNNFNDEYIENNLLISCYNSYILNNGKIYKTNINDSINVLYIDYKFLLKYEYIPNILNMSNKYKQSIINIIFIYENNTYFEHNLLYVLNNKKPYYNIIIFINNKNDIDDNIILKYKKYENIYIFSSLYELLTDDIMLYLTKLADNKTYITLINNNCLINPLLSFKMDEIIDNDYVSNNFDNYSDNKIKYLYKNIINIKKEYPEINDVSINIDEYTNDNIYDYNDYDDYDDTLWNNIKAYIINLKHRTDRLKQSTYQCHKMKLFNYEIFDAVKTDNNIINPIKAWKKNIEYLRSASGCKLSHLNVLKQSLICNKEYILILEDDVIFEQNTIVYVKNAIKQLENIEWDILYLSTNLKDVNDASKISDNLLKIHKGFTTTAQIFKKSKIEEIIKLIEDCDIEIDDTYNYLENKYCVYPMCVYQRESYSDIINTESNYGKFNKKYIY
jgi:GR25 family glycosyltransferase involved in LPS biosynthesis